MEQENSDLIAPRPNSRLKKSQIIDICARLEQENEALRTELRHVVEMAAANEKIWRHIMEIEGILFRTRHLDQFVEQVLGAIKVRFQLDEVVLFLSHPEILERFFPDISGESEPIAENIWILPLPAEVSNAVFEESPSPLLLSSEELAGVLDFVPETGWTIESGVLVPLYVHDTLFGSLLLGSRNADRYQQSHGTDLLEQLGIKIALCLENCLFYERVKDVAVQDRWTGLLSFFQIHAILEREFRKACRLGTALSLLILDLDFVQEAREDYEIGAEVLKHVAGLLKEIFNRDDAFIGRQGSSEFVAVLPDTGAAEAGEVAAYLSQLIRKSPFRINNTAILIQTTIAVAECDSNMKLPQDLLEAAEKELHRLKAMRPPRANGKTL